MDLLDQWVSRNFPTESGDKIKACSALHSQPDSPLCDCDYLDACTGNCLEPVGIPEDDLSFHAAHRAAWPHLREVRS